MGIWVDTDLGFDDLWALHVLRHFGCRVDGVSLVAGNAPLSQVTENARRAKAVYGFDWPIWQGAAHPLGGKLETAIDVLGATGMRSRGRTLPPTMADPIAEGALSAMQTWLTSSGADRGQVLALGPLTNLALLFQNMPDAASKIERLVWMGGSSGPGNHTHLAEFNAAADPEALAVVASQPLAFDIVDLTFCRRAHFSEQQMPPTDPLTSDLLGGYLDIARNRGRASMAIYDPLAALAMAWPDCIGFSPIDLDVSTKHDDTYGATRMEPCEQSSIRIATDAKEDLVALCLSALNKEALDAARQRH